MADRVFVGMSGGVDSSLAAAVLKEEGFDVTGIYMKNWSQNIGGFVCPWREDLADAKRVAVQLGINFKLYDFEAEYKQKVVDYMIEGYKEGLTPNPDIMCNQEIKFKLFLDTALADGADMVATGHYARTNNGRLYMGEDRSKDQSYFLYRTTSQALTKTLFPLGRLEKSQVRTMASERGLITAKKKESMGICFVGKVGIKDFLRQYVETRPGPIIDDTGKQIGKHDGAIFYTIGQRHGLQLGGGLPYYVIDKNMKQNSVTVTTAIDDKKLWREEINLSLCHWINERPQSGQSYQIRIRHRGELLAATLTSVQEDKATLSLDKPVRALMPGQSTVLYENERVVGGGIVTRYT